MALSEDDFQYLGFFEQIGNYRDMQALARALWVHNQDLRARLAGGYGPPYEWNLIGERQFMRRLAESGEPPGRMADNTRTPNDWQFVADRTFLMRQLRHLRRLLADVVGEFAGHLASPEQNRLATRAADIMRSQGQQITELLESNLQAFVTMSFLHSDHRQMQRQLDEARQRLREQMNHESRSPNDARVRRRRNVRRRLD
jgi:hypothetical protein